MTVLWTPYLAIFKHLFMDYYFLFQHGAKLIYETDDDNHPTDNLAGFEMEDMHYGLLLDTANKTSNPYAHFGQPTIWPRGFPVEWIGIPVVKRYKLCRMRTPSVQQGVVNGDPDVDAIYRLSRKHTTVLLNVSFDGRAPPVTLPKGTMAAYNCQNTMFKYPAFWSLPLPPTRHLRITDIWRSYWNQKLLSLIGERLAFYPPRAFQKRNAHSYLEDFQHEKELYYDAERYITFLRKWECQETLLEKCMSKLAYAIAKEGFWLEQDAQLIDAWIADLKDIGYKFPALVPAKNDIVECDINLIFHPSEQEASFNHKPDNELLGSAGNKHNINQFLTEQCGRTVKMSPQQGSTSVGKTIPEVLLLITFEDGDYSDIPHLEAMYRRHFPNIAYCGAGFPHRNLTDSWKFTFLSVPSSSSGSSYRCLVHASRMRYNVSGYIVIDHNVMLNFWNIGRMDRNKIWTMSKFLKLGSDMYGKGNIPSSEYLMDARSTIITAVKQLGGEKSLDFLERLRLLSYFTGPTSAFYIPQRLAKVVATMSQAFLKRRIPLQVAIPSILSIVEDDENFSLLSSKDLTADNSRKFDLDDLHRQQVIGPLPMSKQFIEKNPSVVRIFCLHAQKIVDLW